MVFFSVCTKGGASWEALETPRRWEAGKETTACTREEKAEALGYTVCSYAIGEVRFGRPQIRFPGGVNTGCELTCIGQGGEALPALSAMRLGCEPSASVQCLSLDGSDPQLV